MCGRVLAVVILFLTTSNAFPQCTLTPVASLPFRSTILDLSVDGSRLWAATSYGLTLYDITVDPPRILDSIALPGQTRVVRANNGAAYVGSGNSIQYVRWTGRQLQPAGSVDAGAAVNDLVLTTNELYAATSNGIAQYDLLNPSAPTKTSATFATSGANVSSLALNGSTLYATDGDASVEVFNIAIPNLPQHLGSFTSILPRPIAVSASDGRVYVSDGQQTDLFTGTEVNVSRVGSATFAFGSSSFAPMSSTAIFTAGNDRRLRAFDVSSVGSPVEIFRNELAPTSGTANRINSVVLAAGRLYAGAGDIGLLTYDVQGFVAPFPLRSYITTPANSVAVTNGRVYFGRGAGVVEYTQTVAGALTEGRSWDKSRADVVHDLDNDFLLTSSGNAATLWALSPATPTVVGTATFPAPVQQAVLVGNTTALAVLADKTLWRADLSQAAATPTQIQITLAPQFIARSGSNVVIADLRSDGTTTVGMLNAANTAVATTANVPGVATAGVALSGTTAAVWTFRGITLISFPSGATTLLPQSNTVAATRLSMNGTRLVEMTDASVVVWDTATQKVTAQYALPSSPASISVSPNGLLADLATFDGVAAVQLAPASRMPALIAASNANFYAKKLVATANSVVLFEGRNADIFTTSLEYRGGIRVSGTVDVAANDTAIFTLSNTLVVTSYTRDGQPLASAPIHEGTDAQPLSIAAVNGAVWVSIVRGCPLDCQKKTIVFDARDGLAQTTSMTGALRDVSVQSNRAFVLTELPDEIRVLDIADPAHPVQIAAQKSEGTRLPVSIAPANGAIFVLGEKLWSYPLNLSTPTEVLGAYVDDPAIVATYADQRVRVLDTCMAITGRQFSPQLYSTAAAPQPSFPTASAARAIAVQPGRLYVLTDHSLELWATAPPPVPARRHAAR